MRPLSEPGVRIRAACVSPPSGGVTALNPPADVPCVCGSRQTLALITRGGHLERHYPRCGDCITCEAGGGVRGGPGARPMKVPADASPGQGFHVRLQGPEGGNMPPVDSVLEVRTPDNNRGRIPPLRRVKLTVHPRLDITYLHRVCDRSPPAADRRACACVRSIEPQVVSSCDAPAREC